MDNNPTPVDMQKDIHLFTLYTFSISQLVHPIFFHQQYVTKCPVTKQKEFIHTTFDQALLEKNVKQVFETSLFLAHVRYIFFSKLVSSPTSWEFKGTPMTPPNRLLTTIIPS